MSIRPIMAKDKNRWLYLFRAYADFYEVPVTENVTDQVWAWIHDESEDFWCSVCESASGELLGFIQFQLMHRSLGGSKVVYLSDLYVVPKYRGQGYARQLIDYVFGFAREHSFVNVRWLTQETNYTARQLYDSYQEKSAFILYSINT